jgi:hypothetical protein
MIVNDSETPSTDSRLVIATGVPNLGTGIHTREMLGIQKKRSTKSQGIAELQDWGGILADQETQNRTTYPIGNSRVCHIHTQLCRTAIPGLLSRHTHCYHSMTL